MNYWLPASVVCCVCGVTSDFDAVVGRVCTRCGVSRWMFKPVDGAVVGPKPSRPRPAVERRWLERTP